VNPKTVKYSFGGDDPDNSSPIAGDSRNSTSAGGILGLPSDNLEDSLGFPKIRVSTQHEKYC